MKQSKWLVSALVFVALVSTASAGTIYQSATLGAIGQSSGTGVTSTQYLGDRFQLTDTYNVTSVGGHLSSVGSIFAAIVSLSGATAVPADDPSAFTPLAQTSFTAGIPSADVTVPLSVTLGPGYYALIFGSGRFGATGGGSMPTDNTDLAGASYFSSSTSPTVHWVSDAFGQHNLRFVVNGDAVTAGVPEPATLALLTLGLAPLLALRRRSQNG